MFFFSHPCPLLPCIGTRLTLVQGSGASSSVTTSSHYTFSRRHWVPSSQGGHGSLIPVQPDSPLLLWIIWRLVEDPDTGVQSHALDFLRMLLESDSVQVSICLQSLRCIKLWDRLLLPVCTCAHLPRVLRNL